MAQAWETEVTETLSNQNSGTFTNEPAPLPGEPTHFSFDCDNQAGTPADECDITIHASNDGTNYSDIPIWKARVPNSPASIQPRSGCGPSACSEPMKFSRSSLPSLSQ